MAACKRWEKQEISDDGRSKQDISDARTGSHTVGLLGLLAKKPYTGNAGAQGKHVNDF